MRYLSAAEVVRINEAEVGSSNLRDFGLVDSAVHRPQTVVGGREAFPDVHAKAAALLHALAKSHAFVDGNKRTAFLACVMFYKLNGWDVRLSDDEVVGLMEDVVLDRFAVSQIAGVLEQAAIRPVGEGAGSRTLGILRGRVRIGDDFDEPLPDEVVEGFEGGPGNG